MCVSAHIKGAVFLAYFLNLVQKRFLKQIGKFCWTKESNNIYHHLWRGASWRKFLISSFNRVNQLVTYRKVHFKPILIFQLIQFSVYKDNNVFRLVTVSCFIYGFILVSFSYLSYFGIYFHKALGQKIALLTSALYCDLDIL